MKKALLTGASGFLGKHLQSALQENYEVTGLGRKPSGGNFITADLASEVPDIHVSFDLVVHNAGKAHVVPKTEEEKQAFFDVNLKGTLHLLEGLEKAQALPKSLVFISTIAVYGREFGEGIAEDHPLEGNTPYALSKIEAEKLVEEWGQRMGVKVLILRLPLIAGKNPPGNLGAMIRGIQKGFYFGIGDSSARKSVVLAEDVAELVAKSEVREGTYNLTDGKHPSFKELEELIAQKQGKKAPKALPMGLVNLLGKVGNVLPFFPIDSLKVKKITSNLTFDDAKARKEIGWKPKQVLEGQWL